MAMTAKRTMRFGAGQVKKRIHQGIYAFTTTGATLAVVVPMSRVESVVCMALGAPAADEIFSVNSTVSGTAGADDCAILGTNNQTTLTVTRTGAAKTSGLKFCLIAIGT